MRADTWWDVAVPEVSPRKQVRDARKAYVKAHRPRSGSLTE